MNIGKGYTLVYDPPSGYSWDLHKSGCRDLRNSDNNHCDQFDVVADSAQAAVEDWIDPELEEMGYSQESVRILPCAKD